MSVISIRFNSEEENVIKNYAKAKEKGTLVTIPFEEAIKEWDLE